MPGSSTADRTDRSLTKPVQTAAEAVRDVPDGAVVHVGGFSGLNAPHALLSALAKRAPRGLTIIANGAGSQHEGIGRLILDGYVSRFVASFPKPPGDDDMEKKFTSGDVELLLLPQGTLAECIRAGGAGLGGILTPTGLGTEFARGRQIVEVAGREYVLEPALPGDVALIPVYQADPWGNCRYRYAGQNFNVAMAMAAKTTIALVEELQTTPMPPDQIHTPGIFVDRLVPVDGS